MISKYEQQKEDAFELAFELGLSDYTNELESLMRPAIPLETEAAPDDEIPIGASKIGGAPDVPEGFEWPYWHNWPLSFVAQFRMEDFKAFDLEGVLPDNGLLALFCVIRPQGPIDDSSYQAALGRDERLRDGHRLYYFEDTSSLKRVVIPYPHEQVKPLYVLDETVEGVSAEEAQQSRGYASRLVKGMEPELQTPAVNDYPVIRVFGKSEERDIDEAEELAAWLLETGNSFDHHLLGYAHFFQADHQENAEAYTFGKPIGAAGEGVADWRLLAEFASDENFNWGYGGHSYLWIREQDLAARDFSRTYMTLQR